MVRLPKVGRATTIYTQIARFRFATGCIWDCLHLIVDLPYTLEEMEVQSTMMILTVEQSRQGQQLQSSGGLQHRFGSFFSRLLLWRLG